MNPLHLLPSRLRAAVYVVVAILWTLLFAYGTVRFLSGGEWGYATVTLGLILMFWLGIARSLRVLQSKEADGLAVEQRGDSSKPID